MLGRLLKYELKATARVFLPIYVVLLVFAAITKIITSISPDNLNVPNVISVVLYTTILIGMFVMTFVVMIQRFYRNLLSQEGYLMFTLPVETWKHIMSKLLVSVLWDIGSLVAAILSVMILAIDQIMHNGLLAGFFDAINQVLGVFGSTSSLAVVEFILLFLISMACGTLIIYASIALGHLARQHRIMASLGAFLGLSTLSQILFFCIANAIDMHAFGQSLGMAGSTLHPAVVSFHFAMWFFIAFLALLSVACFTITDFILNRRLNLE